jgi:predicted membrane channel-forming protein YqfA (hemolysin III family)
MHWTLVNYTNPEEVNRFLYRVVVAYACIAIGFAFYVSYVPEILFPGALCVCLPACVHGLSLCAAGRFDIYGHSHQWWHLFALLGFVWCDACLLRLCSCIHWYCRWFYSGISLWHYRYTTPCLSPTTSPQPS